MVVVGPAPFEVDIVVTGGDLLDKPFPAYPGDEPIVFMCYPHGGVETAYPELTKLLIRTL